MTRLFLCEKPSQARDIARVLGADQRRDGYLEGNDVLVTWCFGHLLEMAPPEDYDPDLKQWRLESLPIIPENWVWHVRKDAKKQYTLIVRLFKRADQIVVATDADREGESIAREVMALGGWQGTIFRLWLSALDASSIRKALDNLLPGNKTEALYDAAVARSKADWLVGMTLTRLYTLSARACGVDGVLSVGRVQTPTLKLVVDRDRLIENFMPVPYYDVTAQFHKDAQPFTGKWRVPEPIADESGRCLDRSAAQSVADRCRDQTGTVTLSQTERCKEAAPLLFNLSGLQQEASRRFGMGAQEVLDGAQALYETHKATTYPRTDCCYMPQSQHVEAAAIVASMKDDDRYRSMAQQVDLGRRSKVWNDKKITAHHAIIPTRVKLDTARLKPGEKNLYDLICRRFLAQFLPQHEYDQTTIEITVGQDVFAVTRRVVRVAGWKTVLKVDAKHDDDRVLPAVLNGERLPVVETALENKLTKAPERHTEGTLILAMKSIGKLVDDPVLKKRLKETAGIGTEATRAAIIQTLLKRGFVNKQGKQLVSSTHARALIDALPAPIKDPSTTAVWEQALETIAEGKGNADQFVRDQVTVVTRLTQQVKQAMPQTFKGLAGNGNGKTYSCPKCNSQLRRRPGKSGAFWGCQAYPECSFTLPDNKGKPGKPKEKPVRTGRACPQCSKGQLVQRRAHRGKPNGKTFMGCNRYPACRHTEG